MAIEIGVVVEIGMGLGFVFTVLVVGGVFLGFCRSGWSVVAVEISVALGLALWVWLEMEMEMEMAGFFWVSVGVGCDRGDRCGRGDWCVSWICVYRFGCRWGFFGFL